MQYILREIQPNGDDTVTFLITDRTGREIRVLHGPEGQLYTTREGLPRVECVRRCAHNDHYPTARWIGRCLAAGWPYVEGMRISA